MKLNTTINAVPSETEFIPSDSCIEWSTIQHVTAYNNIEFTYVMFVAGALMFLLAYEFCMEHEKTKKFAPKMAYFSKLMLYIFFFAFFVILKMRLYYYLMGG